MSRATDRLGRARTAIQQILATRKVGTQARPREVSLIDLALEHAQAWAEDRPPKGEPGPDRGGSGSVSERSERSEEAQVKKRALAAHGRIKKNLALLDLVCDELYRDTMYLTEVTPDRPDEETEALPGCRSCARIEIINGRQVGGHDEPVDPKSKAAGLCRWCRDRLDEYESLPVKACDIRHRVSPKAATLWLQANVSRKADDPIPACGSTFTHLGADTHCHRARGHDGEHAGVDRDGKRVTWPQAVPSAA